jgi:5-methylcytosine-specific restriction endonuclease McrA
MALVCSRCGKEVGMLGRMVYDHKYQRCKDCLAVAKKRLEEWRQNFVQACADGLLTREEWGPLKQQKIQYQLEDEEAFSFIRRDALNFVERSFAFAKSDGYLSQEEDSTIRWLMQELQLTQVAAHIQPELDYFLRLRHIREGRLPTIKPSIVLPADELCYLETPATYQKANKSSVTIVPGRLVLTNKKILFIAPSGGGEIPLNKVLNVNEHPSGIFLELSRKANNGFYTVPHPQITAESILAVIRMASRQLIAAGERDTRHIPQHIKMEVWQRDQGRCTQCHASEYLEFDHIIPHSKGGATSVGNLQLLCRRCNLAKSDNL